LATPRHGGGGCRSDAWASECCRRVAEVGCGGGSDDADDDDDDDDDDDGNVEDDDVDEDGTCDDVGSAEGGGTNCSATANRDEDGIAFKSASDCAAVARAATATGAGGAKRAESAEVPPSGVMFMLRDGKTNKRKAANARKTIKCIECERTRDGSM
jgi:hypothetical protein